MSASSLSVQNIEGALADIAPNCDVFRAYLFGSCARGEQHVGSDVDLCLETGPTFSLFNAGGFASELEDRLGASVDVVTEQSCYPHVRENMLRDRVLLYECSIGLGGCHACFKRNRICWRTGAGYEGR